MGSLTITITGIDKLTAKLGRIQGAKILRPPMQRAVYRIQARMQQYPAARPGSKYIRGRGFEGGPRTSENLGKRWVTRIVEVPGGLRGSVGNNVSYAPYVQSKKFQARIHKRLWINTDRYVLDTERKNIVEDFRRAVKEALR